MSDGDDGFGGARATGGVRRTVSRHSSLERGGVGRHSAFMKRAMAGAWGALFLVSGSASAQMISTSLDVTLLGASLGLTPVNSGFEYSDADVFLDIAGASIQLGQFAGTGNGALIFDVTQVTQIQDSQNVLPPIIGATLRSGSLSWDVAFDANSVTITPATPLTEGGVVTVDLQFDVTPVPEPESVAAVGGGLGLFALGRWVRRRSTGA